MRKYTKNGQLETVICNCCGRELRVEQGILKEGACHLETGWGYFSGKDMERHSFDLCEACYDKIVSEFTLPVEKEEETELLKKYIDLAPRDDFRDILEALERFPYFESRRQGE